MYQSFCSVSDYSSDVLYHKCDTQSGNSGSALQSWVGSELYVIGVHKGYPNSTRQLRASLHPAEGLGGPVRLD